MEILFGNLDSYYPYWALNEELHNKMTGVNKPLHVDAFWGDIEHTREYPYFIAEIPKKGALFAYFVEDITVLDNVYVHKDQRGKGIFKNLLKCLHVRALAMGSTEIRVTIAPENTDAVATYLNSGFEYVSRNKFSLKIEEYKERGR